MALSTMVNFTLYMAQVRAEQCLVEGREREDLSVSSVSNYSHMME